MSEQRKGEGNGNYGKRRPGLHSDEFKHRIGKILNDRSKPRKSLKGFKHKMTEERQRIARETIAKNNERGFENRGGKCKFFMVDGVLLQGRYELRFYLESEVKPSRPQRIKTPFGWYAPDFEFNDRFVEIKSTYTIKTCISNNQSKKIVWVRDNIKQVEVKVLKESETVLFLSKYDLLKFAYQPSKNQ